ncbi:hypothetical protein BD769DRAFT_1439084 [Suillus cothurnatus]|nr:hypothetical protein BD769DRAFT_1439084 [Suillus cothurnatus]
MYSIDYITLMLQILFMISSSCASIILIYRIMMTVTCCLSRSLTLTSINRACSLGIATLLALRTSNSGSVPSSCAYDGQGPFRSSYMDSQRLYNK